MTNPLDDLTLNPFGVALKAADEIRKATGVENHDIALTLGSGWGATAEKLGTITHTINAADITGFHASKVAGHKGTLQSVLLPNGKRVLIIGARTHFYEGHSVRHVVHSVRTAEAAGCKTMILTNGAGSIRTEWTPGTVVLIKDHINLTASSPLEGATFVDLTDLYSEELRTKVKEFYPDTPEGVYVQFRGPHYETPAEIVMARTIGGDIAGMSTALEAISAREAGMKILGLSLITNHAAGTMPNQSLNHQEVLDTGKASEERISDMLTTIIRNL